MCSIRGVQYAFRDSVVVPWENLTTAIKSAPDVWTVVAVIVGAGIVERVVELVAKVEVAITYVGSVGANVLLTAAEAAEKVMLTLPASMIDDAIVDAVDAAGLTTAHVSAPALRGDDYLRVGALVQRLIDRAEAIKRRGV